MSEKSADDLRAIEEGHASQASADSSPEDISEIDPPVSTTPPDGGYGWVNVVASFFVHVFVLGNIYAFGVFFPIYMETFNASQAAVAWVGSVSLGLMAGLGVYAGSWADVYGNNIVVFIGGLLIGSGYFLASFSTELWHLYLSQGFVVGMGYSMSFVAGISVVGQWFQKKRGLALGLTVAGSGFGQIVMSLLTAGLITTVGWKITLRYLALINFVGLSLCALFIKRFLPLVPATPTRMGDMCCCGAGTSNKIPKSESGSVANDTVANPSNLTSKPPPQSSLRYFGDKRFVLLYFGLLVAVMGMMMPFVYLPQYAIAHGISYGRAVFLLSIMGISSILGRVSIGHAADFYGRLLMLRLCMFVAGVSTLFWQLCNEYYSMAIYAAIYPAFAGGLISLIPAVSADEFGTEDLGTVMGLLYTSTALGNVFSAPTGGFLYEVYGSYGLPITVSGVCLIMGSVLIAFIHHHGPGEDDSAENKQGSNAHVQLPQSEGEAELDVDTTAMDAKLTTAIVPHNPTSMDSVFEIE